MHTRSKINSNKANGSRGSEFPGFQRILVPVDFSDSSLIALRYAAGLAHKMGATLTVVHVVAADYGCLGIGQEISREYDETRQIQAADFLRRLCNNHISGNTSAELEVRLGRPADEIVAAAAESKADLILLSTHGYTGLDRLLIGSVADRVARLAPCPVFLMRSGKAVSGHKEASRNVLRFKTNRKRSSIAHLATTSRRRRQFLPTKRQVAVIEPINAE